MTYQTRRLIPPAISSIITVSGRSYDPSLGAQDIPDFDARTLEANGWSFVANSGPSSQRPTSAVAPSPLLPGVKFFDTTLDSLICWDGATWRDESGNAQPLILPLQSRLVFLGDSITAGSVGPSFTNYALIASGGRFYVPTNGNQGVGGNTTDNMLSREATWTALGAKVMVVMGGTNDVTNSESAETTTTNLRSIYDAAKNSGARIVACTVLPRNDSTWTGDPSYEPIRQQINTWIRQQADVLVVDLESVFDPSTMTVEGLHPNNTGAAVVGATVGTALASIVDPTSVLFVNETDFGNLLSNSAMTGSQAADAPCTGNIPTGWHAETNATGIAAVCSLTTVNGYDAVNVAYSGTITAAGVVAIYIDTDFTGNVGDVYDAWCGFEATPGANCYGYFMSASGVLTWLPSAPASPQTESISGVFRGFGDALASQTTLSRFQVGAYLNPGVVSGNFTIWAPTWRKVPSSQ